MPTSYPSNIPAIIEIAASVSPDSILDVGPGYGKYGFLMRERVDDFRGRVRIDAVEVYQDYNDRTGTASSHPGAREIYPSLYDNYQYWDYLKAARFWHHQEPDERSDSAPRAEGYDLILMVDVLEHWSPAEAREVLRLSLDIGRQILVSTPVGYVQGESHGNEREAHLSDWPSSDLRVFAEEHAAIWQPLHQNYRRQIAPDSVIGLLRRR